MLVRRLPSAIALLVCSAAIFLTGCQAGDSRICEVEGVLKFRGQPMPGVQLTFQPDDPSTKATSFAMTEADGRFVMFLGGTKGVFKGKVRVCCDDPLTAMGGQTPVPAAVEAPYRALCAKYGAGKSTLEIVIDKPNKNLLLDLE